MGEGRGVYRVLGGGPEGRRPLGRRRHRWEDNFKMDLREIRIDRVKWMQLAQDSLVASLNLWVPKRKFAVLR
jgi:hypothetical protein